MSGVSFWARVAFSLVASDVRATERRSSLSTSFGSLKLSRNWGVGRSQCFSSSTSFSDLPFPFPNTFLA